jgi:hypothetical protein
MAAPFTREPGPGQPADADALAQWHVDLEGDPDADPPVPRHVDVWRSARAHGDTKTRKSRRSLGMPRMAVAALREHLERQAAARRQAGVLWEGNGLVFTTALGTQLDAADDTVSVDHANRSFVT